MLIRKPAGHGDRCDCPILARAVGGDPRRLSYNYCRTVLQRRWIVECNHGCRAQVAVSSSSKAKWHDLGPIDPIKAILIMNEPDGQG